MKIGIISDSHGNVEALKKSVQLFGDVSCILHTGDILYHPPKVTDFSDYRLMECVNYLNALPMPIVAVKGNCDSEVYDELLNFDTSSHTTTYNYNGSIIALNHGHNLNDMAKISLAKDLKARVFISGHTHVPVCEEHDGVILLNPGSISLPRFPMFEPDPTCAIIEDNTIKVLSINTEKVYFETSL